MDQPVLMRSVNYQSYLARRRVPFSGWPGQLSPEDYTCIADDMMRAFGLDDYVGLSMAEPKARPVISVFKAEELASTLGVYKRWYPLLFQKLARKLKPFDLTLELKSKMGFPICERRPDKTVLLRDHFFPDFLRGDYSAVANGFTNVNVRMQHESIKKVRKMPVLTKDGQYEIWDFDESMRLVKFKTIYRYSARDRLVYGPNLLNNFKQVLDNALHNALLESPSMHHDMYRMHDERWTPMKYYFALDAKHFERNVGTIVEWRGRFLGGPYHKCQANITAQPFLVTDVTWKQTYLVEPNRAAGYATQLASGDSCVATVAKELLMCIYAQFYFEEFNCTQDDALEAALAGGMRGFGHLNYGDDNFLHSEDRAKIDRCVQLMSRYLTVEEETPPAFLGWEYTPDVGWSLRRKSFVANFVHNERPPGPPFRPFFFLGLRLREDTYRKYGYPGIEADIDLFWKTLFPYGIDKERCWAVANEEARRVSTGQLPLNYVLDKQYLLTDEERKYLGTASGIGVGLTTRILNHLLEEQNIRLNA